jgi:hypothetical protein
MNERRGRALWRHERSNRQTRGRPSRQCGAPRRGRAPAGAYIAPESDRDAIINELIILFDGPAQREAERLVAVALGDAPDGLQYH